MSVQTIREDEDDRAQAKAVPNGHGGHDFINADGSPFRFGARRYVWIGGAKCYRSYEDYCDD